MVTAERNTSLQMVMFQDCVIISVSIDHTSLQMKIACKMTITDGVNFATKQATIPVLTACLAASQSTEYV